MKVIKFFVSVCFLLFVIRPNAYTQALYEYVNLNRGAWPYIMFSESGVNGARLQATNGNLVVTSLNGATNHLSVNSSTGKVGIGTAAPRQQLHVVGRMFLEGTDYYPSGIMQSYFHWKGHSLIMGTETGTYAHNTIELKPGGSSSGLLTSSLQLYSAVAPNNQVLKVHFSSDGNSYINGGNVGIGTTIPDAKLAVLGTIHAQEVKVDLSVPGPDYVFEKNYNLLTLAEVENYISQNKHLPEVPAAYEMEMNGINLGEMNMLLLKKVEELTLYLFEQEKKNNEQSKVIQRQNELVQELEKRVKVLEE